MRDELRQSFALLPCRSEPRIWIAKPSESCINKFVRGRGLPTAALSVEGPTKNKLCRTIMVSSHPSEPMVNERRLSDPSPGDDCDDVDILVCPCAIQKSDILLSPKNFASCNRQSGYRNLLRCKSYSRPPSSDTRIGREVLVEALTSDSTSFVDSPCYCRHGLQKLGRALEPSGWVFLQQDR